MTTPLTEAAATAADQPLLTVAGHLATPVPHISTQGRTWASAQLTDHTATVEVLMFPSTYAEHGPKFTAGPITLECRVGLSLPPVTALFIAQRVLAVEVAR